MTQKLYPFTIYAENVNTWAESPQLARDIWMRDRTKVAPEIVWYGIDLVVNGPDSIELDVREMAHSVYGGLGKVIFKYVNPALLRSDAMQLAEIILKEQTRIAAEIRRARKAEQKALEIEAVRKELFGD